MSLKGFVKARCPGGCDEFEAEVWTMIRADRDAELKDALLAGRLNLLLCPQCGAAFYHETLVVYFDPAAEIILFVFPYSYRREEKKWRDKMKADYEIVRPGLLKEMKIGFEPGLCFGMEDAKKIIERDNDLAEESDVIACVARELGVKTRRIHAGYARQKGFPLSIPCSTEKFCRDGIMKGAGVVLAKNGRLGRLKKFIGFLEKHPEVPPLAE